MSRTGWDDIRAVVREELAALSLCKGPEPDPMEAWLRGLPVGATGTSTSLLEAFLLTRPALGPEWSVVRFGRRLTRAAAEGKLSRKTDRSGRRVYTVRPRPEVRTQAVALPGGGLTSEEWARLEAVARKRGKGSGAEMVREWLEGAEAVVAVGF